MENKTQEMKEKEAYTEENNFGNITSLDDARLQFVPSEQRKQLIKKIKEADKARKQTKVVFNGMYAHVSRRGNGIVLDVPKSAMRGESARLTMKNEDIEKYLEDGSDTIPVYIVVSKDDDSYERKAQNT